MTVCPCFYLLFPFRQHLLPLSFFTFSHACFSYPCFPLIIACLMLPSIWRLLSYTLPPFCVYLIPLLSCNNPSQNSTFRIFQNCCPPFILLFTLACRIFNINLNFNTNIIIFTFTFKLTLNSSCLQINYRSQIVSILDFLVPSNEIYICSSALLLFCSSVLLPIFLSSSGLCLLFFFLFSLNLFIFASSNSSIPCLL